MDRTLLAARYQLATPEFIQDKLEELERRGYSKNETREVKRRLDQWIKRTVGLDQNGERETTRHDVIAGISEILADSADIALGFYR